LSLRRLLPVSGDAGLLASARIVAYGLGTVTPIILARRLAVEEMGGYRDILLVSFTCMQVLQLGLPQSLFYFLPSRLEERWTAVTHSLMVLAAIAIALSVGFLAGRSWLASAFQLPPLADLGLVIGAFVGVSVLTTLLEALPIADGRIRLAALLALGSELFRSVLLLGVALLQPTLVALALALLGFGLFRTALLGLTVRPYLGRGSWVNAEMARAQFAFAGPYAVSLVLAAAAATADKYLVSAAYGPAVFAAYSLGMTTIPLVDILFNSQADVVLSRMKVSRDNGDIETIRGLWVDIVRRMGLFIFPVFTLLLITGNDLIVALYGERYAASGVIFTIFVFHLLRYVAPYGLLPRVYGDTVFIFWASAASLIGTLIALFAFTAIWGYVGAAIAYVVSVYLISVPQVVKGYFLLGVSGRRFLPWLSLVRLIAAAAIAGVAILILRPLVQGPEWLKLATLGSVFGIVYLAGLALSGDLRNAST
jgi:O-antigen/teichoic acid export membrane protein